MMPNDDRLSWREVGALDQEEHDAMMAFALERRDRIYRLHREGMTPKEIARQVGGLAPYRVRKIIAWAERSLSISDTPNTIGPYSQSNGVTARGDA